MHKTLLTYLLVMAGYVCTAQYTNNRAPLQANPYTTLPIGAIQPQAWLKDQLLRMKDGLTGHLDTKYPEVMSSRNAWLGGDGDAWERGPYWIDGLLPLAYILKDEALIAKVRPWVEWTITHQRPDGYIGPDTTSQPIRHEPGVQKDNRKDWWPRMVMLKILQQYYNATGDKRVISTLTKYFRYQLQELPRHPLDHWTFWANQRGADNMIVAYWLYNITGDAFLLQLTDLLYQQTFPFTTVFLNEYQKQNGIAHLYPYNIPNKYPFNQELINKLHVGQMQSFHCVNLAQGIKTPVIYYQQHPDPMYIKAAKKAFNDIDIFHGQAQGMYGGDEPMHGNAPTQGIELCSIVEMMYSLENMLAITGDVEFADRLEKIAYNALPTQATDDYNYRQYFQCANQVSATKAKRNFFEDDPHGGVDLCFGLLTGYPCCTSNMHQGWPKLVQNLWYGTKDSGLAALIYAPCEVSAQVAGGQTIRIKEETNYPFEENIRFIITTRKTTAFTLQLRIPSWCSDARILVNGKVVNENPAAGSIIPVLRTWNNNDKIELQLPMKVSISRWVESAAAVERGPLVYALKMQENWKMVDGYYEVRSDSSWNYGLLNKALRDPQRSFKVQTHNMSGKYPWNIENAPVSITVKAKQIPQWTLYSNMAGPLPHSLPQHLPDVPETTITLIPYGCTTLRIAEFPLVN